MQHSHLAQLGIGTRPGPTHTKDNGKTFMDLHGIWTRFVGTTDVCTERFPEFQSIANRRR